MNLRLSGEGIRFRLTQDEMLRVLAGEAVEETVPLVPPLHVAVKLDDAASPLHLESTSGEIVLTVARGRLAEIAARFPDVDEISGAGGVTLEVDRHSPRGQ